MSRQNELRNKAANPLFKPKTSRHNRGTFNPKVAGSIPARPIRNSLKMRNKFDYGFSDGPGMGVQVPSHREGTFHLGRLEFPLGALPVMLLCLSSRLWWSVFEEAVEAAGEVALEAAVCLASCLAFFQPPFDVDDRGWV